MAGILTFFASPLGKIAGVIAAVAAAGIAFALFVAYERAVGAQKLADKVKAATEAEQARQIGVNDYWAKWADGASQQVDQQKANLNDLQKQLALATANDHAQCLSPAATDMLRAIGRPGGQAPAGTATAQPLR